MRNIKNELNTYLNDDYKLFEQYFLKIGCTFSIFISSSSLFYYVLFDYGHPRPQFIFMAFAVSFLFLFIPVFILKNMQTKSFLLVVIGGLVLNIQIKMSSLMPLISSGSDHGRWLARVSDTVSAGAVTGSDMYAVSPLYILSMSIGNIILDFQLFIIRYFTGLVAILLPIVSLGLLYALSHSFKSNSYRFCSIGYLLIIGTPLLFRTSALIESEIYALHWFILAILCSVLLIDSRSDRMVILLSLILLSGVMLHFLYGLVILITVIGTSIATIFYRRKYSFHKESSIAIIAIIGLIWIPTWILWSIWAGTAVSVLSSMASISLPHSLLELFIPTEGSAAAGSGSDGADLPATLRLFRYTSPIVIGLIGTIGLIIIILKNINGNSNRRSLSILTISTLVFLINIFALVIGLEYRLEYRLYFFTFTLLAILGAIGLAELRHIVPTNSYKLMNILFVGLIIVFAFTSPVTPVANNIDPQLGGEEWAVTPADLTAYESIHSYTSSEPWLVYDSEHNHIKSNITQQHFYFKPVVDDDYFGYMDELPCYDDSKVYNSRPTYLCYE